MNADELALILGAWKQAETDSLPRESWQSAGSTYLRERLTIVAERCCHDFPGDLLEIGCLAGSTTILLAKVARMYGRRVIAVDPFAIGTQNIPDGTILETFLKTTDPYRDIIDFIRKDSRDPEAIAYIKNRSLAFSFVDGLHEHDACLSDIRACYHSQLIAIDDWGWNKGIEQAITEARGTRQCIMEKPFHEAYLL